MRSVAVLACAALLSGCFGYNASAKRWAYAGDTILILGGGGAIAADLATREAACEGTGCSDFSLPFGGGTVAGAILVTAGLVGIIINATRPTVKTSR